jgi:dTDP-4-amino-4,6-dideoxygalactose transaminase
MMNIIPLVDLHAQYLSIKVDIDKAIEKILRTTSFIGGKDITDFENEFSKYLDVGHSIGCANGTDSIEILLKTLNIGTGDEVIVPALSWISTSEAVSSVGATPVFVDIEKDYYTINVDLIEEKITNRTKAIIPVHLYGHPADMAKILCLAQKYGLKVIEDCAQSHGATIKGRMTGTFGDAGSFSFFPGKNLGAYGDAGAMVTNNPDLAERARLIAKHGQKGRHNHVVEGRNSRLDTLQAAILNVKLPHLERWTNLRIKWGTAYLELLKESGLGLPKIKDSFRHVFHLFVVRVNNRESLQQFLKEKGIETSIHYPTALPFLPCYKHLNKTPSDYPVSHEYQNKVLSLPLFPELTLEKIKYITDNINDFIAGAKG